MTGRRPPLAVRLRPWGVGLVLAGLLYLAVAATVAHHGRRQLAEGRRLRAEGRLPSAIYVLGGAARMRTPLAEAYRAAEAELEEIAHDRTVPHALQRLAHREVRRAIAARRVFAVDDPEAFEHAARAENPDGPVPGVEPAEGAGTFSPLRATGAAACFVIWVWASLHLIRRGIDGAGRLRPAAVRWGIVWLVGLVAWAVLTRFAAT
ncbi:MAG: hypothetical protein D6705_01190 [Deltaproteobacteria bacterium]|nr:MAG: hypothetical protein D6705_01190 [Deltaproteobacteria bacterium]